MTVLAREDAPAQAPAPGAAHRPGVPPGSGQVMVRDGLSMTLSAGLTAAVGLLAWIAAARLLPRHDVGRAAAFVSGFMLVASLGDLGLDRALMRWVPWAGRHRRSLVLRCYAAVLAASFVAALAVLLLPAGAEIRAAEPGPGLVLFVGASMSWALFQFQDPVLVSLGRARWVPWENVSIGVARVVILVVAAPLLGTGGVLLSWVVPAAGGVIVVSVLVRRVLTAEQAPAGAGSAGAGSAGAGRLPGRREVLGLLGPIYPARVCSAIVVNLAPLLVTSRFGSAAGAVFFIAWMAGNTVDYAAISFAQSVTVRIAHEPERAWPLLVLGGRKVAMFFGPALVLGALLAGPLLSVFGPAYAGLGTTLLRLVLLGCLPRLLTTLVLALTVARGRGWLAGALEGASAVGVTGVAALVPKGALTEIGIGFVAVQVAVAAAAAIALLQFRRTTASRFAARSGRLAGSQKES
jgi:O-antigen/teichoic acid export membrane protein